MELKEGDVAENQHIRSSRGAAEYNLTFEMVLPGGGPAGEFEKQNCTRPPGSTIWIVYTDEPLMVFSGPIVKVGRFCQSTVEKSTVQSNGGQPTT